MSPLIGRIWTNGDPFLVADRGDVASWTGFHADYERLAIRPGRYILS